jgi:hypothetical protein
MNAIRLSRTKEAAAPQASINRFRSVACYSSA